MTSLPHIAYFLGANSPAGFYSLYSELIQPEQAQAVYILKGGPGCGKSTLGRTLVKIYPATGGKVLYKGQDIARLGKEEEKHFRKEVQMIFQDPYASLNPRMTVKELICASLDVFSIGTKEERIEKVLDIMEKVGLPLEYLNRYPHEFSGGQRQRIMIARALVLNPDFVVCDEPVSALDVSVRAQVLNLMKDLQQELSLTYLFISHDLSVVKFIADRVCVMFLGTICELGPTEELYDKPLHPYTRFLLNAIPKADPRLRGETKELLSGEIPSPVNPPSGCRFRTRCPYADERCAAEVPEFKEVSSGHWAACHHLDKVK